MRSPLPPPLAPVAFCNTRNDKNWPALVLRRRHQSFSRMLKNPPSLSFRGVRQPTDEEESRPDQIGVSRARFLASLGMTTFTKVFQHPVSLPHHESQSIYAMRSCQPPSGRWSRGRAGRSHAPSDKACYSMSFTSGRLKPGKTGEVRECSGRSVAANSKLPLSWR